MQMKVSSARKDLKELFREGVRDTIHQTLGANPSFHESLVELVSLELQQLRSNGKNKTGRR
jgi:hypothetical protein